MRGQRRDYWNTDEHRRGENGKAGRKARQEDMDGGESEINGGREGGRGLTGVKRKRGGRYRRDKTEREEKWRKEEEKHI